MKGGITISELKSFYGCDTTRLDGKGIKIGIVTVGFSREISENVNTFCRINNIKTKSPVIIGEESCFSVPKWAAETAIDIELVKAFAPQADIVVFCAKSNAESDIVEAICNLSKWTFPKCEFQNPQKLHIVLMCLGGKEITQKQRLEQLFESNDSIYVCSAGNENFSFYPASSKNTLTVGGTAWDFLGDRIVEAPWEKCPKDTPNIWFFATTRHGNGIRVFVNGEREAVGTSVSAACVAGIIALLLQKNKDKLYEIGGRKVIDSCFAKNAKGNAISRIFDIIGQLD